MKRTILTVAVLLLSMGAVVAQQALQWPEVTREMKPGARWWWMGSAVDNANLQWAIGQYAQTGIGTLEITPIYGVTGNERNELNYLSAGWMNALKVCQETGDAQGVDIDMNGGTGWPFGGPMISVTDAAGKLVTKNETKTSDGTTALTFNVQTPESNAPLNKVMAYRQDGEGVVDVTSFVEGNTLRWTAPAGEWLLLAIYNGHTLQQVKRAAPGGEGYVLDHYNADAVARYLKYFDSHFSAANARWPHSFFNDSYEVYGADWTPQMFSEFEKYRGYKLEEHMDQLLGLGKRKDTGNQVLADYRQTLSDMLLNNFTRQWTEWAHQHGVTTRNQGHGSPGNLIDFYAAVDIPEIEGFGITDFKIKCLRTDEGFTSKNLSDLATLKYASSAAHVTGKKMTSSETFTWLTEHFRTSLSQMKPEVDLMFVAGVNHIFFHGTTYTPQQAAWPGWKFYASIDMSPTNSIWRDAPSFMDYATRCQSFLQMGQPDNDLLVYAPFQDAMHKNTGANAARLQLFDINTLSDKIPSMVTCVKNVEAAGLDCDFISDQLLLTTTFTDGMLQTAAGTRYRGLIVPVSTNIPANVQNHLDELKNQGAIIVYKNDAASVTSFGVQGEELRTKLGLRVIRRKSDAGHHYFVTNLSPSDVAGMVSLAVPFADAALFNPMTGRVRKAYTENGKVWIALKSGESIILQATTSAIGLEERDEPVVEMTGIDVTSKWTLSFTDDSYPANRLGHYNLDKLSTWEQLDAATAEAMGTGVYETTFSVDAKLLAMANGGMLISLGDVRESARVYINNVYAGCAWSVPFELDITGLLHEGDNTLRIEVTNLPANRIRKMDIDGTTWRIFKDVNILDVVNGNTSVSNVKYDQWSLVPSGLNSKVQLIPLRRQTTELDAKLIGFTQQAADYYPIYQLTTPSGQKVSHLTAAETTGATFTGYSFDAEQSLLIVTGTAPGYIEFSATDDAGGVSTTYLYAYGAYYQQRVIDFTQDAAPLCGWQVMSNQTAITGFEGNHVWRRAPEKSTTTVELYAGVTAQSEKNTYYFYYPGYGMAPNNDCQLMITDAQAGDICMLSYLQGSAAKPAYQAADSLVTLLSCDDAASGLSVALTSRSAYYIYRGLQHYRPRSIAESIDAIRPSAVPSSCFYTLQGVRVARPQRGIYIKDGRKVIVK